MHKTAWANKASSVPSDKIRPTPPPPSNSKGKGKSAVPEPPKSKAVRQLESLKTALSASAGNPQKDPKGGCFCQAREHPLSTYSSLCRSCGLVLCEINLPQYNCPHCAASLLTGTQRDALIARLEDQIATTLTKEALLRERAAEEARRAVGAFPTLGNAPRPPPAPAVPQTRTVMSLNSKTKKVTVSSFSTPSPSPSRPASRAESVDEEPVRVRAPPAEVPFAAAAKQDPLRPWRDLSGGGAVYIPPPNLDDDDDNAKGPNNKRRRNKGKAKENKGGAAPDEAGSSNQ
ncbi:hypothetical protein K438DRAFT_1826486 [Mycena galopus ATCC 62051]|nr:hypothetical protein K438DRAFT_1826486 [Mycena galopus ATCC 62051]